MIVLAGTADLIRLVTSSANALDVHATYLDSTAAAPYTPQRQNTTIATATTTTVLAAPGASVTRDLRTLSAHARGGANTITVEYYDGAAAFRLESVALTTGEKLEYEHGAGWRVRSADGSLKGVGAVGPIGATGPVGPYAGAISIPYTFSTTTTDADPGAGTLRLDNATQNLATTIRADLLDSLGSTVTALLDSFALANVSIKGQLRLVDLTTPTNWIVFSLTAVASPSGYRNITVAVIASSSASPFANGASVLLMFTPSSSTVFTLADGFVVDLLPTTNARGTVAAAATVITTVPLTSGYWHSITYEYTAKRSTGAYYVYRTQVECYRPAAGSATLHLVPTLTPTEYPLDQNQSVAITVSGNNVLFTLTNGSADSWTYAVYSGSIARPLP
jgi:hypothetical protein